MSIEIICALIAFSGAVISAATSWAVARMTAKKEIEQIKASWAREDLLAYQEQFSRMVKTVNDYITRIEDGRWADEESATNEILACMALSKGNVAVSLSRLNAAIKNESVQQARAALQEVIAQYQEQTNGVTE